MEDWKSHEPKILIFIHIIVEVARSSNIGFIFAAKTTMLSWRKTATPRPNPQYYLKDHHNSYSDVFMHIIFISLYSLFTTTKYLRKWINSLSLRLSKNRCTYVCVSVCTCLKKKAVNLVVIVAYPPAVSAEFGQVACVSRRSSYP